MAMLERDATCNGPESEASLVKAKLMVNTRGLQLIRYPTHTSPTIPSIPTTTTNITTPSTTPRAFAQESGRGMKWEMFASQAGKEDYYKVGLQPAKRAKLQSKSSANRNPLTQWYRACTG